MSDLPLPPSRLQLGQFAVGPLAWGMWRSGGSAAETARLVHTGLDHDINLIDTADIYGFDGKAGFGDAEGVLGAVLEAEPGLRKRMVLATKGGVRPPLPYDQSAVYLREAIDGSLRRLRTDRIDLYQIHRPDILAHPQEVAGVLEEAVASGKVLEIGVSNFSLAQIEALQHFLGRPLAATQPEISPLRIEPFANGELDQAMRLGLRPLGWSPLSGGRLLRPETDRDRAVAAALDAVHPDRSIAALSWLMAHPAGIVPILGTQRADRIAAAARARDLRWTRQQWYDVLVAARGEPLP